MKKLSTSLVSLLIFMQFSFLTTLSNAQCTPQGDPAVFGDHVWNVYVWNSGGLTDDGHAWNDNYSGYYVDTALNMNTEARWNANAAPSSASGYSGCTVGDEYHSWSAKRQGFTCNYYRINITVHDDGAQLFIDGTKVWEHMGCCDSHNGIWYGILNDSSEVIFRVTEATGGSYGAMAIIPASAISSSASVLDCITSSITLSSFGATSYLWSTGETTSSISVNTPGTYTLQSNTVGCSLNSSITIATPVATLSGTNCFGGGNLNATINRTPAVLEWKLNDSTVRTDMTSYVEGISGTPGIAASIATAFVCSDNSGNLYVVDNSNYRVLKFAPGSSAYTVVAGGNGYGTGLNQLTGSTGIAVDNDGNLYVCNYDRVSKWAPGASSGTIVAGGNGSGTGLNQFNYPRNVFVDAAGNIYVSDASNHRVMKWAPGASSGVVVAGGNGSGTGNNQFNYPCGLATDESGNVYVADYNNHRVQKWAPGASSGITVAGGNDYGYSTNQLYYPIAIKLDPAGNIYVLNYYSGYIMRWAPGASSGVHITATCCVTLNGPPDMAVDGSGNIFVADPYHGNVKLFHSTINSSYSPPGPGNYTVVATAFNGCTFTSNVTTVYPYPTIPFTQNQFFCTGSSTTLDAGLHDQYLWSNGATTQTTSVNTAGTYTLTLTDNGCESSGSFYVAEQTPVVNVTANPSSTCIGSPSQLNATLVSGGLQYYSRTYYIDGSHLNSLPYSCSYDNRYGYSYNYPGFTYADSGIGTATSVKVEFNVGNYYSSGYPTNIYLNNLNTQAVGNFTPPHYRYCQAIDTANFVSMNISTANYHVGTGNTLYFYGSYDFGFIPSSAINHYYAKVTVQYQKPVVSYSWAPGGDTTSHPIVFPISTTTYTVTATSYGCSSTSTVAVNTATAPGDTATFGNNVWNVYVFNVGGETNTGQSWKNAYSGYYVDTNINFNTQPRWGTSSSPSAASGYNGCVVNNDNHSWSAKRHGFPCGIYHIDVASHDDAAQLFVNGIKVWEHIGCCDSHSNVWTGFLDNNSTIVFRCTEGGGVSHGAINLNREGSLTVNGPTIICPGYSVDLTASTSDSYLWSTGETTQTITVASTGNYSVDMTINGCTRTMSQSITVTPLDTPVILSGSGPDFHLCPGSNVFLYTNYSPLVSYSWSDGDQYPSTYINTSGNYSLTITDALGCSAISHVTVVSGVAGTDSAFGNNTWKVNAYRQGLVNYNYYGYNYTYGREWHPDDYSGYYLDSTLNFNSQNKWNQNSNPSTAPGYSGCSVHNDEISWSAKRQGFPCGVYQIDVVNHDDEAELYVDGIKVWDNSSALTNAWTGALNASSKVEFRVNEQYGSSNGAINLSIVGATSSFINIGGNPVACAGQSYTLTSTLTGTYLWSNGETTNPAYAASSGSYSVIVTDQTGCSLTSDPVSITILPDAAPVANITASANSICEWNTVILSSDSTSGNSWSTSETTQGISVNNGGNYTLTVTNIAGCMDQNTINIVQGFTPPAPVATNSGAVCQGSSVNLVASGMAPGGQVASFNGINQYVNVTQDIPEHNFTIEMWVKTSEANEGIFSATNGYLGSSGHDRHLYLNNGELSARVWQGSGWGSGVHINDGKWHHIALTAQDGVGQRIYVDGVLAPNSSSYDHSDFTSQAQINIGFSNDGSPNYFSGQIDNVRIWSEAKSQTDIRDNMARETPLNSTNLVYESSLNGNLYATIGNNGTAPNGIAYAAPDYYTYTWTGTGAPAPSTSETQITSVLSTSGTYSVTASTGGCTPSASASTNVAVIWASSYYPDADGDGWGSSSAAPLVSCTNPGAGYVQNDLDCNDANASINLDGTEICNSVDDNCDGQIDEGVTTTFYADADHDGYGNPNSTTQACSVPSGYVTNSTDCNDGNINVHPGSTEICNSIDDNCNGQIDETSLTASASSNSPLCAGSALHLTATSSGGTSYSWTGPNGFTSSQQNPNINNATLAAAGIYTVTVNFPGGCSLTATTSVTINSATAITIQPTGQTACAGGLITFSVTATGGNLTYQWKKGNMNISGATNSAYTIANINSGNAGNYKVVVSGSCGGNVTSNVVALTVNPVPVLNFSTTPATCTSGTNGSVTLSVTGVSGALTYTWSNGAHTQNISGLTPGTYTVTVSTAVGCSKTGSATVGYTCPKPTGVTVSSISTTSASVSWTGVSCAVNYKLRYKATSLATWNYFTQTTTTKSLTGLASGTAYEVQVETFCGTNDSSGYTASVTFTTTSIPCSNGTNLTTTNITAVSATLNWTAANDPAEWGIQYKTTPGNSWVTVSPNPAGSARSVTITGLVAHKTYNWKLRARCGSTWTTYTSAVSFTTLTSRFPEDETSVKPTLNLYPNPSSGQFVVNLKLADDVNTEADIQIMNSLGQTIYVDRTKIVNGNLYDEVKLDGLVSKGNYFVRVTVGEKVFTGKVIIQ